jgi:hypothetical protein
MSSRCQLLGVTGSGLAYLGARLTALAVEDRDRVSELVIPCARSVRPFLSSGLDGSPRAGQKDAWSGASSDNQPDCETTSHPY